MISAGTRKALRFYQLLGLTGLLVMVGSLGGWAALSHIQGAVIASGTVVVESHSKRVQHRDGGIVAEIGVEEGNRVEAGDLLVRLDETETRAQLAIFESVLDEFEAKRARLKAERDGDGAISFPEALLARHSQASVAEMIAGQKRLFETQKAALAGRKEQLAQRIGQLEQEIGGIEAQIVSNQEQARLVEGERADLQTLLDKGLVPVSRVLALQREAARLRGDVGQLTTEKARTQSRIGETRLQIIQLEDDARGKTLQELREAEARIAELRERRLEAQTQLARTEIRAPRAGWVHQLNVHTIGGVIAAGETVMLIVPDLDELVIEAQVRPQDIDEVSEGQGAIVRFTAFNQRTTLQALAEVVQVSADLTQPAENRPPFYAVRLRLPSDQMELVGNLKLKPGMPAEVFIQTRSRTPLSYLLQPLSDQIARALRET